MNPVLLLALGVLVLAVLMGYFLELGKVLKTWMVLAIAMAAIAFGLGGDFALGLLMMVAYGLPLLLIPVVVGTFAGLQYRNKHYVFANILFIPVATLLALFGLGLL